MRQGDWQPQSGSEEKLRDVLALSFKGLSTTAKDMFLDTVSVLRGTSCELALAAWEGSSSDVLIALKELKRRGLISVDAGGKLQVRARERCGSGPVFCCFAV